MESKINRKNYIIWVIFLIYLACIPCIQAQSYIIIGNPPPVLAPIGDKTVSEGSVLTFTLTANDPDGNTITYGTTEALPMGASLDPTTGVFTWEPEFKQRGEYSINFTASDGESLDYESILITVVKASPPEECSSAVEVQEVLETEFAATSQACCEINSAGIWYPNDCPSGWNICDKKYGLLITTSGVTFEGDGIEIITPSGQCCDGIKVYNKTSTLSNVIIRNVTVTNWHTGILYDEVDGGEISGSNITGTQNGIYLSDARNLFIFSNNISDSAVYGLRVANFGLETGSNTIYNNYFNNYYNTGPVADFRPNFWNVTKGEGKRIIGDGNLIGGNYWATPDKLGHSETCTCANDGFCYEEFVIESPDNTDWLPLCIPVVYNIDIQVEGSTSGWVLPIGTDTFINGFHMTVWTDANEWTVGVYDMIDKNKPPLSGGKMVEYSPFSGDGGEYVGFPSPKELTNFIKVNANDGPFVEVGSGSQYPGSLLEGIGSGTFDYFIDVQQTTVWGDSRLPFPEVYRIVVVFQGNVVG